MRIVQLSDIHLSKDNIKDFRQFYLKALQKDLFECHRDKKVDLLVITGDLIDKGGHSFKSHLAYSVFQEEFLKEINSKLNIGSQKFLFIPGNHDVDEEKIDEFSEEGIRAKLKTIEKINDFIDEHHNKEHDVLNRNLHFKKFEREYFKKSKEKYISNFESCYVHKIENKRIGIACFNSAWRCSTELAKEDLLLGTRQILNANEFFDKKKCDFVIGLIHHPIDKFSNVETTEIISLFQHLDFDVLLMGHVHEGKTDYTIGNSGTIYASVSRASFNNPREKIDGYKSGYIIYDIDLDLLHVRAQFRKYYHKRLEFGIDTDYTKDGQFSTDLVPRKEREPFLKLLKLNNKSLEVYESDINSSLIISGANTIAPKELNDIFVLPKLSENPVTYDYENITKPEFLSIQDILELHDDILFFGAKEIGKTTLLNKIYLEIAQNFPKYKKIPISLDYKDLKNKKVKSIVSKFLNEPMKLTEELLINGEILLLIDNLEEDENTKYSKTSLREFINEYKNVRVIGATSEKFELLLTRENSFWELLEFKPIFIGYVSIKEFKKLACKWFTRNNPDWIKNNLEKLLKVFEILRIPRTFFAISLFLWIIEKQENYTPINKANLIDQFLLYILEGLKIENAEAGAYTYFKKIELLKEIALKMFQDGDSENEYALTIIDLLKIIEDSFSLNQRKWSIPDKLDEFVEKGILKIDSAKNLVKFRYECFFEYFLSFNIDKNQKFREFVFSDSEFLSFVEEIDFYTARNQSDIDALKWVFAKLDDAFQKIDEIISDDVDKYIPQDSLILKELKIKKIMPEIRKNKLSDEQIEEVMNEQMERLPVDDSIKIKTQMDLIINFPIVLELAGRVLKNCENIKNPDLINSSLDMLITRTAKYSIFFQSLIAKNLHDKVEELEHDDEKKKYLELILMIPFMPLVSQLQLLTWVGTEFLTIPLEKKIDMLEKTGTGVLSELELFFTLFLYSDLKLPDSIKKIDKSIKLLTKGSIAELFFFKIFLYYMFKSENTPELLVYEKQMKNLIAKAKGVSAKSAKKFIDDRIKKIKDEFNSNNKK